MTNKAIFLDRDGVINVDHAYVHKVEDFDFMPGIFELCQYLKGLDYRLIIATNQSGIGRGYYSEDEFLKLSEWMKAKFVDNQCEIDALYYSPYHPEAAQPPYLKNSECRKPAPGMLLQAIKDFELEPMDCAMIGDNETDIQAAKAAGLGRLILLDTENKSLNGSSSDASEVWHSLLDGLKRF
jgi:D-glycero-D-manno-heptose 1,7-bisphosphate phosphatase